MYLSDEVKVYLSNGTDKKGGDTDLTDRRHTRLMQQRSHQTSNTINTVILNTKLVLTSLGGMRQ